MENHPIPQDVTGFKFKLIGSITVKQFLYLVGGGVMAVLLIFVFPGTIFIRAPLALFFAGFAACLAFIPIDGRPMDKMVMSFIQAIPQENLYMYHKHGVNLATYEMFKPPAPVNVPQQKSNQASDYRRQLLFTNFGGSQIQPDPQEQAMLENVHALFTQGATTPISGTPTPQVIARPQQQPVSPQKIQVVIPQQPKQEKKVEGPPPAAAPPQQAQPAPQIIDEKIVIQLPQMPGAAERAVQQANQTINTIQASADQRVNEAKKERELMENRIKELEAQKQQQQTIKPQLDQAPTPEKVTTISQQQNQFKAGFPNLPDVPNVILGIIRDPRGRVIPNILVEIVDTSNVPVRAFKTNQLGQFASATPLPAGTYKLYLEDPQKKHEFEPIQINLNNQIFQPLEIVSIDDREKLRKELFQN